MQGVRVVCLGAGQDVGRSCVVITIGGKNVMLDCGGSFVALFFVCVFCFFCPGMHMGFEDARRFPDFRHLAKDDLTEVLDAVLISHFHLDHCGKQQQKGCSCRPRSFF